ncbi:MAG TPA: recombinase family protein [Acidimicrobiales bacterium]|nr:recombinase family protein [Acidimicrobiales bacterium]
MTAAVAYCRISKDDRGEALGVDRQERLCRKLAKDRGLDIVEVLVDNDTSAFRSKSRRPAFDRLVGMLGDGSVGAVVAYHADRLYRRTGDLERLVGVIESTKVQVHTVASGNVDLTNASGRMIARMLGAAAQGESERMGERIRAKHDELAAAGKHPGGRPPYGYSKGYVVDQAEAEAVRWMAQRVLEGSSLLRVARDLDDRGVTTREGRPWHHSSVRATLVNPAVAGLRVHRREVAGPGAWDPILDRQTWEAVRAVLADPARKRTRPARKFVLAGLVENPNGDRMNGATVGDRRVYATRVVQGRPRPRPALSIGADELEDLIVGMVLTAVDEADLPTPDQAPDIDVTAIEAEMAELADLRGRGEITMQEWLAARGPLLERLQAASIAARQTKRHSATVKLLAKKGAVRKAWPDLDFDTRREVITALIERVVIAPATRGKWTPIEDRISPEHGGGVQWKA